MVENLALVSFNDADEFAKEIIRDPKGITGGFVRACVVRRPHPQTPDVFFVTVEAAFVRGHELIKLVGFCGEEWLSVMEPTKATHGKADRVMAVLEVTCSNYNIPLRAGRVEPISVRHVVHEARDTREAVTT